LQVQDFYANVWATAIADDENAKLLSAIVHGTNDVQMSSFTHKTSRFVAWVKGHITVADLEKHCARGTKDLDFMKNLGEDPAVAKALVEVRLTALRSSRLSIESARRDPRLLQQICRRPV
jgi:hypothetical protein